MMRAKYRRTLVGLILASCSTVSFGADVSAGKQRAAACGGCHGTDGISTAPNYPNLAGQKEAYLVKAIKDYRSGERIDPVMKAMVSGLTESDIENLAAYFASLPRK